MSDLSTNTLWFASHSYSKQRPVHKENAHKPQFHKPQPHKQQPHKWVAVLAYNGAMFHGWQYQKHQPEAKTLQAALQQAISRVADEDISVVCAGRTDAGVHASGQVIHFETYATRSPYNWWMGINANLPSGMSLEWIEQAEEGFHARFSAYARRYFYVIVNTKVRPALQADQLSWWRYPLDVVPMQQAANSLLGEWDFSAFRARACQAKSAVKRLHHIRIVRSGDLVIADVKASAFLYHMVRNLMGVLIPIGQGVADVGWAAQVLASKDRRQAGITAPPQGLYFAKAYYPQCYQVSRQRFFPRFLSAVSGLMDDG